jgi:DNA primase
MMYRSRRAFSFATYVERHFPGASVSGDERIITCIECEHPKLYINTVKNVWLCYRCDARGTAFAFVKRHLGLGDRETARILAGDEYADGAVTVPYDPVVFGRIAHRRTIAPPVAPPFALNYRRLPCETILGRAAWDYLQSRGVTSEQIVTHEIGVATRGVLAGRVILPVLMGGRFVYYQARAVGPCGKMKYRNPANGETPLTASEVLFNFDVAALYGRVTLVEGYFDALAEGATGVATFGKTLSAAQLALLTSRRGLAVTVKRDEDVSMAYALGIAKQLDDAGLTDVHVVQPYGDPADRLGTKQEATYSFAAYIAARTGVRYGES